jgi:hypothetical protein
VNDSSDILEGMQPIPVRDVLAWARWFETAERTVAKTQISAAITVSTVFLGLNHHWGSGAPLLFETMVFGLDEDDPLADYQERYRTWHEAEQGHEAVVALVRQALASEETP